MKNMSVVKKRSELAVTKKRLEEGFVTVGFLGTSITDARVDHNWPEPVMRWLVNRYPHVKFKVENAAISATGSELAVFRAKRDILDKACDLVFVEYAVNDIIGERSFRSRESLLRLLQDGRRDVVLVYTFHQNMYADMAASRQPASIAQFEQLADHYGIDSVWMSLHALQQVRQGLIRWEEWLPDGLHPTERGSLCYAESVIDYLKEALSTSEVVAPSEKARQLPKPIDPLVWERVENVALREIRTEGPWLLRNWPQLPWIEELLETSAIGARLTIPFRGRGIALGFDFGFYSAEFDYSLDGGEWQYSDRDRPYWYPDRGYFLVNTLFDELTPGEHELRIKVAHGDTEQCKGTNFRLAFAAAIQ